MVNKYSNTCERSSIKCLKRLDGSGDQQGMYGQKWGKNMSVFQYPTKQYFITPKSPFWRTVTSIYPDITCRSSLRKSMIHTFACPGPWTILSSNFPCIPKLLSFSPRIIHSQIKPFFSGVKGVPLAISIYIEAKAISTVRIFLKSGQ